MSGKTKKLKQRDTAVLIAAGALWCGVGMPLAAQAQSNAVDERCAALARLASPELLITTASMVPPGPPPASDAGAALTGSADGKQLLPAHCKVVGMLAPRIGTAGVQYGIGFELRLPQRWSGRFLYQGGGGMDGVVNPAIGAIPLHGATAAPALARGYAVVSTDSGHQSHSNAEVDFAADQLAKLDYAYAAIGKVRAVAMQLIKAFYDAAPRHSYFMGCSNGGRGALMAAQRFPDEFDGIVAGSPGFRLSKATIGEAWRVKAFLKAAPGGDAMSPVLAAALSDGDLKIVANAVREQCDGADGLKDGSIEAMSACHFQPRTLICGQAQTGQCLTPLQVDALETAFDAAHDSEGRKLYSDWAWDTGIADAGWRGWVLGHSTDPLRPDAVNATMGLQALSAYFMYPPHKGALSDQIDFDKVAAQIAQTGAINDATSTMYATFKQRGGKLIVYQGNSDPVFSSNDLRAYLDVMASDEGGSAELANWSRAFFVPGMTHCGGGPALDDFDPLTAVQNWVELNQAPAFLLAKGKAFPGRSRPLCPYPAEARYNGRGEVELAASFSCLAPQGRQ